MKKVLVTGGAGFIGAHLVKRLLAAEDIAAVTVLDALTYAGHQENLGEAMLSPKLRFVPGNILDEPLVDDLVSQATAVVHLAAESHVDRSFLQAGNFLATNVLGTHTVLDAARRHKIPKVVHVSTDEVYGPLVSGAATEDYPLSPTVPYAASKAASDLVAQSYWHTYRVPVCITRSSNNYGPAQHPEKIIPSFITSLLKGKPVTLHGSGQHQRNWLHVADNCAGIELALRNGKPGETYNIAGGTDLTNKQLTGMLLDVLGLDWDLVQYGPDRPSNDIRYSMDWTKMAQLGYTPARELADGLAETVDWYRRNPDRWAPLLRNPSAPRASITLATPMGS